MSNLQARVFTAVILLPMVIASIFLLDTFWFALVFAGILLLAAWEWAELSYLSTYKTIAFVAVSASLLFLVWHWQGLILMPLLWVSMVLWSIATILMFSYQPKSETPHYLWLKQGLGWLILSTAWLSLVDLHQQSQGSWLVLYIFVLIWCADVGAYFAGRIFGKTKLAAKISPGKTWEGVLGALLLTSVYALLVSVYTDLFDSDWGVVVISIITVAISIVGDLAESVLKRERGFKDSGQLLPGHGGILDRIDSLLAALPVFVCLQRTVM